MDDTGLAEIAQRRPDVLVSEVPGGDGHASLRKVGMLATVSATARRMPPETGEAGA